MAYGRWENEVLDRLERIETLVRGLNQPVPPTGEEGWLSKREMAKHLGCGTRWLEQRVSEGMPHRKLAGGLKFRISDVDRWLKDGGHFDE